MSPKALLLGLGKGQRLHSRVGSSCSFSQVSRLWASHRNPGMQVPGNWVRNPTGQPWMFPEGVECGT